MLLRVMRLVPRNLKPRLISSIDPDETVSGAGSCDSVSLSKGTAAPSSNRRRFYIGIFIGAAALFIFALTFAQHAGNQSNRFDFPTSSRREHAIWPPHPLRLLLRR